MKSFRIIFAALAATAAVVSCTKEITPPNFENDEVNPEGTRVIAVSFAPQTKTALDGFQPQFVAGDKILVANGIGEPDTCVVSVDDGKATISTKLTGTLKAVYPAKAARMDEQNPKAIGGVLVSTEQDGTFASANICMAKSIPEDAKEVTFQNKTAVFRIIPAAGKNAQYVEVSAEGFEIANDYEDESAYQSGDVIHVAPITSDTVYVSTRVPSSLTIGDLKFSDGTNVKTITGERAAEAIAIGTIYNVALPVFVENVTLDKSTLDITVGDPEVKLTATVTPENATDKKVSWTSDHDEIATVDQEGNVHAVAPGTATITVTTADGGKTATCTVTVKSSRFTITREETHITGASFLVMKGSEAVTEASLGEELKVDITCPNGYIVGGITVFKTGDYVIQVEVGPDGSFTMPAYAVTVLVTFELDESGGGTELNPGGLL